MYRQIQIQRYTIENNTYTVKQTHMCVCYKLRISQCMGRVLGFNVFIFLKINCFALLFAVIDLVHDVEARHDLFQLLTSSGNVF